MNDLEPPDDDLPPPDGAPVEGLGPPTGPPVDLPVPPASGPYPPPPGAAPSFGWVPPAPASGAGPGAPGSPSQPPESWAVPGGVAPVGPPEPPGAPQFGVQAQYGAQPPGPYGAQPPGPYGAQPPAPYGAQPPAPYGAQPTFGAQPPFGGQPPGAVPPPPGGFGALPPPPVGPAGYGVAAPYQAYRPSVGAGPRFDYGGFGARFLASLIDGIAVAVLPYGAYFVAAATAPQVAGPCTSNSIGSATFDGSTFVCTQPDPAVMVPVILVAALVYLVLLFVVVIKPIAKDGSSLGLRMAGLRVVDANSGAPIGYGRAIGRHLFASIFSGCICYLGYFWMLFNDRKQTWHDLVSSSVVVRK